MRTRHCPPRKRNKAKSRMEHSCEQNPEDTIVKFPTGKVNVVEDFITDFWEVLTPEMVNRLELVLINDIGLSKQKAAEFIINLKEIRKENFHEKTAQEKKTVRIGVRNQWIKEVSNTIGCHLAEAVVDFLLSSRTNRSKRLTENILNHLCLLTGENATVETAETRIERTMVVVADRMAKWVDEALTDIERRRGFRNDIDVVSSESSESIMLSIKSSQSDYKLTEYEASLYPVYPFIPVLLDSTIFDQEHLHTAPEVGGDEGQSMQESISAEEDTTTDDESSSEIEEDIEIIEEDEEEEAGGDRYIVQYKDKTKREHKYKKSTKTKPKTEKKLDERKDNESTPSNQGKENMIKKGGGKSKEKSIDDDSVVDNKDKKDKKRKSKKNKGDKNKEKKDKNTNNVKTAQKRKDTVSEIENNNTVKEKNLIDEEDSEDVEYDEEIGEEETEMNNGESDKLESEEEPEEEQEDEELEVEEENDVEEEEKSEVEEEKSEVEEEESEVEKEESEVGEEESEVQKEESEVGEEERREEEEEEEEEKEEEEEDEKLKDKSKQGDYTPSKSTSTTCLTVEDVPPKTSIKRQLPDVLDLVKDDMKFLGKGDTKSERPRAIKQILEERFKNIAKEGGKKSLDTLMGHNIDEAASIAANWIENILSSADPDIVLKPLSLSKPVSMSKPSSIAKQLSVSKPSPISNISSISSIFKKDSAFQIKRADDSFYKASKLSYRNVAQKVADVRGIELSEIMSPMNASSTKEWAEWALSATNMGDKWGKWLDTKISEMEKRLLNGGPRASLDRYKSWTDWRNAAGQEAENWRAENRRLKDEGTLWKKKFQKEPVNNHEKINKNIFY